MVNYTNNLNNLYNYNAYNDQLIKNQLDITNVYAGLKNEKITIDLDKVPLDKAIKELTIDMGKAQEHLKAIEQLSKDSGVKEATIDSIGNELAKTQDNFSFNIVNFAKETTDLGLRSADWGFKVEDRLQSIIRNYEGTEEFNDLYDNALFDAYLIDKYADFDPMGNPLIKDGGFTWGLDQMGNLNKSINPEVIAMEKVGFLIFKDVYKAITKKMLQDVKDGKKDPIIQKTILPSETSSPAGAAIGGGGGGIWAGDSYGTGTGGGGFGLGWGGGFGGGFGGGSGGGGSTKRGSVIVEMGTGVLNPKDSPEYDKEADIVEQT